MYGPMTHVKKQLNPQIILNELSAYHETIAISGQIAFYFK